MVDIVIIGLICDCIGAFAILLPDTRMRWLIQYYGTAGRLERARVKVFQHGKELTKSDHGFDELRTFAVDNTDEELNSEVYKISISSGKLRLHQSSHQRVYISGISRLDRDIQADVDSHVYPLGASLLLIGFGIQILARVLG